MALERDAVLRALAGARTTRSVEQLEVTVVELARVADVRGCCGERYLLVEQQHGSLVRRWFTREGDLEELALSACPRCAVPLLPHTHVTGRRLSTSHAPA
jgi:hypothetical protein